MSFPAITTPLKFLKWQTLYETEKPFQIFINIPPDAPDQRTTNLVYEDVATTITDVRSLPEEERPGLDRMGFKYVKDKLEGVVDWENSESVERGYLPGVERLVRRELGMEGKGGRVEIFDWRVSSSPKRKGRRGDMRLIGVWRVVKEKRARGGGIDYRSE